MSESAIVVATSCPESHRELIVPVLESAGLTMFDDNLSGWYDSLFQDTDVEHNLTATTVQPDVASIEKVASLLSEKNGTSRLLADNRNLYLLDFWAKFLTEARFLLFYTQPETTVAYNLLQGNRTPQEIIEAWQATNRQLIRFQQRHHDRAILLDAELAAQEIHALAGICGQI
ncbi:MAG: hypothetical protein HKN08_05775, partial [Gammaproteobacteria bacterium]|nr:hypothetical protein [Gammaproteobacteria bacterium]